MAIAAVFAIVVSVNARPLMAYAKLLFFQYQLQIGKAEMNLDDVIPVDMQIEDFSKGEEIKGVSKEERYGYDYRNQTELVERTGLKLSNSDELKFGTISLSVSRKYHNVHMTTSVYYKSQRVWMNGMFVLEGFKGEEWGYGDTSGYLLSKYKYSGDKYAYFITSKAYEKDTQVVYFTDKNIMYQMFVDNTEEGTKLAQNIIDCITE